MSKNKKIRRRYNVSYFFSTGIKSFFRNSFMNFAAIVILVSALLICGSFVLLVMNIDYNISLIDDFNEVKVFADLSASDAKISEIEKQITALPQVASCTLIPKEESIIKERERYGEEHAHLFERYIENESENPLPDTFVVEYKDVNEVDTLVYNLERIDGVDNVKNRKDIADNINRVKKVISVVCVIFTVLLVFVSGLIVANTMSIALKSREEEITIMRYIGATNTFITLPYVIESLITSLVSTVIALVLQFFAYGYISKGIVADYGIVETIPLTTEYKLFIILAFAVISVVMSIISTLISAARYSKA